ncbi:MAG: hypothetical protein LBE06_03880, partial [Azoarcus sp.]|nr:hypothetical protein [Azoarcus sp.]
MSYAGTVLFDHDADGIRTGTGWLKGDTTLAENGIVSINLGGDGTRVNLGNGNSLASTATYTRIDGSEGAAGAVVDGNASNLDLAD